MATNISTVLLNAPIEKVWNTLTQPELVKQWQYGSDLITNWKTGSEIRFRNEWEGQVFEQWGTVLEVIPNQKVKYSLFFPRPELEDKPENYFIMSYVLSEENNKVKLEIIQEDNRPGAVQEEPQGEENPIIQALKTLIES
ncbi:SRPBCC family protein [Flavobacterium chilense]|uniref:Activator of Hsp90 ATPase homolog 1-like protein n=1 Tax=Flavobacterium chilense TaxID=946677 RepID=A0A1M7D4Q0_9FLAO|nr:MULTISPECIES: SRPBCC family protein [Flavobacterium]SHL74502.1 Activator of Hsp90 ATPase homolog 1-like protein [Flavobacterium chilense]